MPDQADLAAGRRHRRQGRRRPAGHAGHLPARPARLGPGLRAADHGGEHLRRHLVRQGLERAGQRARSSRRRPTSTSTWSAAHGETGAPQAGFTECLNNMDRARSPCGTTPRRRPGSLEADDSPVAGKIGYVAGAGREDQDLRLALRLVLGASRRPARRRTTPGSSSPGPRARTTRTSSASKLGWSKVPAGKRASTYANPTTSRSAAAFAGADARTPSQSADPRTPACSRGPRPASSSSDIPEFTDLGTAGLAGRSARPSPGRRVGRHRRWTRASRLADDVAEQVPRSEREGRR